MARSNQSFANIDNTLLDATDEDLDGTMIVGVRTGGGANNAYAFFIDANGDVNYRKSTNGGRTWGSNVVIDATDDYSSVCVWYDRWTPGDTTGNTIHIAATNTTDNSIIYFSLGVDDDLAETNNNVLVHNPTTITPPAGVRSISKGADGDIYICSTATTVAGLYIHKSTDAGAIWVDESDDGAGNDITTDYPGSDARGLILPLLTDNDMMIVASEAAGNHGEAWLMDGITTSFTVTDLFGAGNLAMVALTGTLDKTTGDLWIVSGDVGAQLYLLRYDSSADIWDGRVVLLGNPTAQGIQDFKANCAICRDQTNGILFLSYSQGTFSALEQPVHLFSSDDGKTWSQPVLSKNDRNSDDLPFHYCPAILLDTNERWLAVTYNDDQQDLAISTLQGIGELDKDGGIPYKTVSGVVKDNAGTAVSGAEVKVFAHGPEHMTGWVFDSHKFQGTAKTDGSGNYKCHVTDMERRNLRYFTVANETTGWHPTFKSDFTNRARWAKPASDGVKINTTTKKMDWNASIDAQAYETLDVEKEYNGGTTFDPFMMMARFKLVIANVTQNVSTNASAIFIGFVARNNSADVNADHFGYRIQISDTVLAHQTVGGSGNAVNGTAINTFARAVTAETVYVQIIRKNPTDWTVGLYSDNLFQTLLEEETMTNLSTTINDTFGFSISTDNLVTDHVLDGTVDFVEIDWLTTDLIFDTKRYDDEDPTTNAVDASLILDED